MLKTGTLLGKYRLQRKIGDGGFATVYRAVDTVEGIRVALKVPRPALVTAEMLDAFRREARLTATLDHPHILPLKNAEFIDGHFVIVHPLGQMTLTERMERRVTVRQALDYGQQMLDALAYAHAKRVLHCDLKPDNLLIFPPERVRLADFGIAKVTAKTMLSASGSGTLGYVAPEQAMGKPSFRSDCFSAGLILWEMLAGELPTWPYTWPPAGYPTLRRKVHRDLVGFLRKAIAVDERRRFQNGGRMLAAFLRVRPTVLAAVTRRRATRRVTTDWRDVRIRQFRRVFGARLGLRHACTRCQGPVSEAMIACPWCGTSRRLFGGETAFPRRCRRCRRGMKLDWRFCAWCYGAAQEPETDRRYTDARYVTRCADCRGHLMPFMRYCPWCRRKVQRVWKMDGTRDACRGCGWGVAREFWRACPWCARRLGRAD